jgi:glycosyltransferase involved in cell wall biosynthesis
MPDLTKKSILCITSELPWPLDTGGKLRTFHLLRALAHQFHVRVIVPVSSAHDEAIQQLQDHNITVIPVHVAAKNAFNQVGKALSAAVQSKPYVLYRRHWHPAVKQAILDAAASCNPDLLYLDHLDSHQYRSVLPNCPALLDLHNIYSLIVERYASEQSNRLKRSYFQREARLLKQVESGLCRNINLLFAVSQIEVEHYQQLGVKSVHLVPNGVDCSLYSHLPCGRSPEGLKLLFLGTMSWGPNSHAASFLIETVLPEVRKKYPDAEAWIVGRHPPANLQQHHGKNGVHVTGGVPDIVPYFRDANLLVVALESGGGTRLKILEAFAAGLPVISTSVGVEGIDASDGIELCIEDRSTFAHRIFNLIEHPALAQDMASKARQLVLAQYDWKSIGEKASNLIHQHLRAE